MSMRLRDQQLFATVQTTNATQTVIATYTPPGPPAVFGITVRVFASKSDGTVVRSWKLEGTARIVTGVITLLGTLVDLLAGQGDAGAALWSATLTVSGGTVQVKATGALATTINWAAYVTCDIWTP